MPLRPWARLVVSLGGVACAFCASVAVADGSQQAGEDPSGYFYDLRGRQYVTSSPTDFVARVRPNSGASAAHRPAWLGDAKPPPAPAGAELSTQIIRTEAALARRGLHVVRGTVSRGAEASHPEVEWMLPILYRRGSQVPVYPTDQIVMRFDPSVSATAAQKIIDAAGCQVVRRDAWRTGRCIIRVADPTKMNPLAVANALHETPGVQYAHPDFVLLRRTCDAPVIEDPLYSQQWSLDGDTAKGASANADINVEGAWSIGSGGIGEGDPSIRVAVIDDSVEWTHPDLVDNYVMGRNYDVYPDDPAYDDPSPVAAYERHGTAVSGVILASPNTIGCRGVAPRCRLIGIKAMDAPISSLADAFYYAMDPNGDSNYSDGAAVINNSWQLTDGEIQPPDLVNAINDAAVLGRDGKGCVVVFASANSAHTVNGASVLAQLSTVLCVGGSSSFATHSEYSDVGPEVAVVAPTSDSEPPETRQEALRITTTDDVGSWGYNTQESPEGDYTNVFTGTSASAPAASGVCALVLSLNPELRALQVFGILEHTAVQIDPAAARINGVSRHSHRFGYGRVDAASAATAAIAGVVWPAPVKDLTCTVLTDDVSLTWTDPTRDCVSTLVVRANTPFAWHPTDGMGYTIGQEVAPGIVAVADNLTGTYTATDLPPNGYFFGVYPHSAQYGYGWGRACHGFVGATELFYDDSEDADPGWTHGGAGDVWIRSIPTSYVSPYGSDVTVYHNGPLLGIRSGRAINGNFCWGPSMEDWPYTYLPDSNCWLRTPTIDLTGYHGPAFLTFHDWCLLETPYDHCEIKVLDETGMPIGTLESNFGGDYDWTERVYDISPYKNRAIQIQFGLVSDDMIERDGWFLDEVRVVTTSPPNIPPIATNVFATASRSIPTEVQLAASGPEPGEVLSFTITSLPSNGGLSDPGGGPITLPSLPYTVTGDGSIVMYTAAPNHLGPDTFSFLASDRFAHSNEATATVTTEAYRCDFDADGDVDLGDFEDFQNCFQGPNHPVPPECEKADFDDDTDVDLADFVVFQGCFNGPNRRPKLPCQALP